MNGEEKTEIQNTFRHELGLVFEPIKETLKVVNSTMVKHSEDIRGNQVEIVNVKSHVKIISGRVWALIFGIPTLLIAIIAGISYLTG